MQRPFSHVLNVSSVNSCMTCVSMCTVPLPCFLLFALSVSSLCLSPFSLSPLSPCLSLLSLCLSLSLSVCLSLSLLSLPLSICFSFSLFYLSLSLSLSLPLLSPLCLNLSPLSLSPRSPYLSRSPLLVYVYVSAHSFPASPLFYRHPSIQNTILPNKVLWSALFLLPSSSYLEPTLCFCPPFYLYQLL